MAVIHYSALVTGIKGRTRGAIFQSGPGGQIVRSAGSFNRSNNARWQKQKNNTQIAAQNWSALTTAQQAAWNAMAQNFPSINRFGEKRLTSGYNLYMKANQRNLAANAGLINDPSMPMQLTDITGAEIINNAHNALTVDINNIPTGNEVVLIDACAPVRKGRRQPPGGFKRIFAGSTGSGIINTSVQYTAVFGTVIVGSTFTYMVYILNTVTGQKSTRFIVPVAPF